MKCTDPGWREYYDETLMPLKHVRLIVWQILWDYMPCYWITKAEVNKLVNDIYGCGPKTIENVLNAMVKENRLKFQKFGDVRMWRMK